ncbi:hypothetical protein STAS_18210 [Striga asiatica]|uniref:Uncharacterized protein n=1 Tax=Striga asiatica TaxID=4170 RepID=A0A5A7Q944_STRAF|nr:hypothetical protein STAS_18210 [Striga asiatica]
MANSLQIQASLKSPPSIIPTSSFGKDNNTPQTKPWSYLGATISTPRRLQNGRRIVYRDRKGIACNGFLLPVDPWAPTIDSQSVASQLFAFSLFPYMGFLYFITKSKSAPKLTLFGFYFLLAFVGATKEFRSKTISISEKAKVHYGTSLSNVDWLHGGAESLLTLTNIFIVLGLRDALRKTRDENTITPNSSFGIKDEEKSSI